MVEAGGLRVAVTGAAGFIGRAVTERLERGGLGRIAALRLNDIRPCGHSTADVVAGSYADAAVRDRLIGDGVDILFHLASLPGGAAERDPALGRRVNLDGSLALFDAVARADGPPVVVYASSIAALGRPEQAVSVATAPRPTGSYGTHKAMVELYLADLTRRGLIDSRALRPAGIVARPREAYAGFATAWMSDLFHAAVEGRHAAIPVRKEAHVWLQSVDSVADNLIHAAKMAAAGLPQHRVWTLPATRVRIGVLVAALQRRGASGFDVIYGDAATDQPPLDASDALVAGFGSDGGSERLVDAVLARIRAVGSEACPPLVNSVLPE